MLSFYHVMVRSLVFKEHFVTLLQKLWGDKTSSYLYYIDNKSGNFWIHDNQWTFLRRMLCISINNRKNTFSSSQWYNTRSIKSWVQWKWWKIYNHGLVVTMTFDNCMNSLHSNESFVPCDCVIIHAVIVLWYSWKLWGGGREGDVIFMCFVNTILAKGGQKTKNSWIFMLTIMLWCRCTGRCRLYINHSPPMLSSPVHLHHTMNESMNS